MNDIINCFKKLSVIADSFIPDQVFYIAVPFVAFMAYIKIFRSNS